MFGRVETIRQMTEKLLADMSSNALDGLEIGSVKTRLKEIEDTLDELGTRVSNIGDINEDDLNQTLRDHAESLDQIDEKFNDMPDLSEYDDFKENTANELSTLTEAHEELKEQYSELESRYSELEGRNATLEKWCTELELRLSKLTSIVSPIGI